MTAGFLKEDVGSVEVTGDTSREVHGILGEQFASTLAAAKAGAGWALRVLYEDLAPVAVGYLRLHGAAEPEDVASEAFLGVFRNLATFEGDEDGFRSWVFTIVHRRLIDERRRRGRRPRLDPIDETDPLVSDGDVEAEALTGLEDHWVGEVLDELTEDQRAVVLLRTLAGLSVEETAEILDKRRGAVRALQHRGLERIRRAIDRGQLAVPHAGGGTTEGRG